MKVPAAGLLWRMRVYILAVLASMMVCIEMFGPF